MFGTLPKILAALTTLGVGGLILSSALLDDEPPSDEPSGPAAANAAADEAAASDESSFESPEPWRDRLVVTECPEFPARDGSRMLNGNWFARWDGVPNKRYFPGGHFLDSAHLTISSNEDTGEFSVRGPKWHRDGAPSIVELPDRTGQINTIELESPEGSVLRTSLSFYSAPDSTLRLNQQSPNRIAGNWEMRDKDVEGEKIFGTVTWDRALPVVTRTVVTSEQKIFSKAQADTEANAEFCGSRIVRMSTPAVATLTYDKQLWSRRISRLRANRPQFFIDVYGDNFWGDHHVRFDEENTGIEAMSARKIRASDGSGKIVGLRIRFNIWSGVQPGFYTVYLDDMAIPFELDIPNFYPSVTMKYVNYNPTNDTERELQEIPINQTFWVRASVENPERFDDTAPLIVRWRDREYSAKAKKLDDGEYRAGPFLVSENLLPSTVAPERDPCKKSNGGR